MSHSVHDTASHNEILRQACLLPCVGYDFCSSAVQSTIVSEEAALRDAPNLFSPRAVTAALQSKWGRIADYIFVDNAFEVLVDGLISSGEDKGGSR